MRRCILFAILLVSILSSCSSKKTASREDENGISFLKDRGIVVDTNRPFYSSDVVVPEIFDSVWKMRDILSKDGLKINLEKYKGKQSRVYMYPVLKLPFMINKESSAEARAVIISCNKDIICSYIEFISELRSIPPLSLDGKSLVDLSGISWNEWKAKMDGDGDKHLVIWQYYDALRSGDYEEAYWYIYDKENIKKEDFIKIAKENSLLYIDFLDIQQYKESSGDECYFIVKAMVGGGQGKSKKKEYEILFDLKKYDGENKYGGWKIYKTKIR